MGHRSDQQEAGGLLAFLACTAPQPHSRDQLMALLWGSHFEAQARQNLRQALTRLRRVLGEDTLISSGELVSLQPGVVACDVARFEALLADGSRDALNGRGRPLQGPSAGRHRDPGGGLDRMARRPAPAPGRPGARCHGQARRAGAAGGQPPSTRSAPPTGDSDQQSARGRASPGRSGHWQPQGAEPTRSSTTNILSRFSSASSTWSRTQTPGRSPPISASLTLARSDPEARAMPPTRATGRVFPRSPTGLRSPCCRFANHERRPRAGIFRRRHGRGDHHRACRAFAGSS